MAVFNDKWSPMVILLNDLTSFKVWLSDKSWNKCQDTALVYRGKWNKTHQYVSVQDLVKNKEYNVVFFFVLFGFFPLRADNVSLSDLIYQSHLRSQDVSLEEIKKLEKMFITSIESKIIYNHFLFVFTFM